MKRSKIIIKHFSPEYRLKNGVGGLLCLDFFVLLSIIGKLFILNFNFALHRIVIELRI